MKLTNSLWPTAVLLLALSPYPATAQVDPKPTPDEASLAIESNLGEHWYSVFFLGNKVGWQYDRWYEAEDYICVDAEGTMSLSSSGRTVTIATRSTECYNSIYPYEIVSNIESQTVDGQEIRAVGSVDNGQITYIVETESQKRSFSWPAKDMTLLSAVPWGGQARLKVGDSFTQTEHNVIAQEISNETLTFLGWKEPDNSDPRGQRLALWRKESTNSGRLDISLTENFVVVEVTMAPAIHVALQTKDEALNIPDTPFNIDATTNVVAKGKAGRLGPIGASRMRVRLKTSSPIGLGKTARQVSTMESDTSTLLEIRSCPLTMEPEPELAPHLKCDVDIPCDLETVRTLATSIARGKADVLGQALSLAEWVRHEFTYTTDVRLATSDQVLRDKRGDCSEYSRAMVLLARSIGLPARQVFGLAMADDSPPTFGYHAWVQVWTKEFGWVDIDPTWGTFPVDATHITLDVGSNMSMAGHIGSIELEIIELEYINGLKYECHKDRTVLIPH